MKRTRSWAANKGTYGGAGLASHSGANECHRCGDDIEDWKDARKARGKWVHRWCVSGADDE